MYIIYTKVVYKLGTCLRSNFCLSIYIPLGSLDASFRRVMVSQQLENLVSELVYEAAMLITDVVNDTVKQVH